MDKFLLRSLMFVPGNNEKLMNSAAKCEADCLLPDIEDSVQPFSEKNNARQMIKNFVDSGKFEGKYVFPRVNDRESGCLLDDIECLMIPGVDGFMYPKSETGRDVYFFDKLLETLEYKKGIPVGTYKIIPLIETGAAVLNVQDICKSSERVIAIAFGCEDFVKDIRGIHDKDEETLSTPRSIIAMGARACNVIPIDTVHIKVHDLEDLEKNLIIAKNFGFEGMLTLHPKELELVHDYFSPSEKEYQHSLEILKLAEEASSSGKGVAILNGKFIGPPMVATAKNIIERYELIQDKKRSHSNVHRLKAA
jgi:citrate lyase subunit beta/citryl-CoA lyase